MTEGPCALLPRVAYIKALDWEKPERHWQIVN